MTPFSVFRNKNSTSKSAFPLLLDIQSDILSELETRVVIPLAPLEKVKGKIMNRLMPVLNIEGKVYVLYTAQIAGISKRELGALVGNLSAHRRDILGALDFLVTGI